MDISGRDNSELREKLAAKQHEIWAHWMRYLFSICRENSDGTYTIPPDEVKHWQYQINTPYSDLPEDNKKSDREQAEKILKILGLHQ